MAKTTRTPDAERTHAYYQRQKERGLARISLYVPEAARDEFWDTVDRLRAKWRRDGLID